LAERSEAGRQLGRRIESPPAHFGLLALFLFAIVALLVAEGLTEHQTGTARTPIEDIGDPAIPDGDTILGFEDGELVAKNQPPGKRIALTFDDGPDPRWTPRIADTLKRLDVPATFFVVGERTVSNPDIVRDLRDDGFEIGNHTFNHANLVGGVDLFRDLQLSLTESVISGAAGVRPRLVRPPYSATPRSVGEDEVDEFSSIAEQGYLIALSDVDTEDWRQPGTDAIVESVTSLDDDRGGTVLMHDGGGDRTDTIEAIERFVPLMQERGFEFVPLSEMVGASPDELEPASSGGEELRGEMLIGSLKVANTITGVLTALLIPIALLAILRAIFVVVVAQMHARRWRRMEHPEGYTPPVSIIVPAFNEAAGIEPAVKSLAASDYPEFEVIVVDDGSSDGTGEIVEKMGLPRVTVLREPNRGKAEALNLGISRAKHDIIVAVDADTVFEEQTVRKIVRPFADKWVGAVAGNAKVGNRGGILGRWQHIDYVTGFNLDRRLYDVMNCMPTVPGAVGAFRREALDDIGGFSPDTLAEDTDATIALGRLGWKVVYAEDARGFTEVPNKLGGLWRQRYRWSFGTMQSVWKHRSALIGRKQGRSRIGRLGLPYLIAFQILLPLLAPLVDLFALYGLLFLDPIPVLAYWGGFNLLMLAMAVYAFRLDGESLKPLWALPFQQFVYRQLMYLVVIQSIASAFQGIRLRWSHVERSGDVEVTT
jgi:cellulose synthase/poly-beta-1,6-N-acetylglucosamine synthase-like glycosyltransferase/peptidoglycan/xylan/chitin deacetylase (PgdA/CDA1 family)